MRKFLLLLLFASAANAQVTKGTISNDYPLASNKFVAIPFDSSAFDILAFVDRPGPGISAGVSMREGEKFYAVTTGIFFFFGQVYFDKSCSGSVRTFAIIQNGDFRKVVGSTGLPNKAVSCEEGITLQTNGMVFLNAGEYVTFNVFQDTGNVLAIASKWCSANDCAPGTWGVAIKVW